MSSPFRICNNTDQIDTFNQICPRLKSLRPLADPFEIEQFFLDINDEKIANFTCQQQNICERDNINQIVNKFTQVAL